MLNLICAAFGFDRDRVLNFSRSLTTIAKKEGRVEKNFWLHFSDYALFTNFVFPLDQAVVISVTLDGKTHEMTIRVLTNENVEWYSKSYKLLSDDRKKSVHSTFGGLCFCVLTKHSLYPEFERLLVADSYMFFVRLIWGIPYKGQFDNVNKLGGDVEWYSVFGVKPSCGKPDCKRQFKSLSVRVHPDRLNDYPFVLNATTEEVDAFKEIRHTTQQALNEAWEKYEKAGPKLKRSLSDAGWDEFPLTKNTDFKLNNQNVLDVARGMVPER